MLSNGATNSYTWDRANRLIEWDNGVTADLTAYAYDGLGNRISQSLGTTSPTVTNYLLDLQPGLAVVLAETTGAMVIRNVHAPRGIHAHKDASGAWEWMVQDGLGSVHGVVDNTVNVLESRNYDPYGESFGVTGSSQTAYGFTGEQTDNNGLLYLRARYYNSAAGVFTALDPFEGFWHEPMSINGYGYVHGNPVNFTDPSGMWPCPDCVTPVQPILTENPILSIQQDEWEVPNVVWGDYSPEDLIGLAEWCNNGSCDDQFNGIIFIPGILPSNQIPPEQIEQLRQLCDNNVMWACYSLALALSPRCKSGDRAACREIADLCNRLGNGYAGVENQNKRLCDRLLRTTCDEETYQQLYND